MNNIRGSRGLPSGERTGGRAGGRVRARTATGLECVSSLNMRVNFCRPSCTSCVPISHCGRRRRTHGARRKENLREAPP